MLSINDIKAIVARVCEKYGVKSAYLFGSYARGEATDKSDIDILVEKGGIRSYKDYFYFCDDLERGLGTRVDVIMDGKGLRPRLLDSIRQDQVLLYGA